MGASDVDSETPHHRLGVVSDHTGPMRTADAASSCTWCDFVGEGSTLGSARLLRDKHIANDCPKASRREAAKAASRLHWT